MGHEFDKTAFDGSGSIHNVSVVVQLSCPCFLRERMSSFPPSGQGSGGDGGAALDLTNYGDTQQYYETYEQ